MSEKNRKPKKFLTLTERKQVIEQSGAGGSGRSLGTKFGVNKNVVGNILKNKDGILTQIGQNSNPNRKRIHQTTKNDELNGKVYEFFTACRSMNIPISGPLLQEKARAIAESLQVEGFVASNGWLYKFQTRHNIQFKTLSGESDEVKPETIDQEVAGIDNAAELQQLQDLIDIPLLNDDEADQLDMHIETSEDCGDTIDQVMHAVVDEDEANVSDDGDEEQVEVVEKPPITFNEVMKCIDVLANYALQNLSEDYFITTQNLKTAVENQAYEAIQKKKKQTNMLNYSSPQ